jgi:hypothetical protein
VIKFDFKREYYSEEALPRQKAKEESKEQAVAGKTFFALIKLEKETLA